MNVYDSLKMEELLSPFGYISTDEMKEADLIIINTCHIREKAAEKMYSELGRIKQLKDNRKKLYNKDIIVVVAGCTGQAEGDEIFSRSPWVSIVVGPQSFYTLPELLSKVNRDNQKYTELDFIEEAKFDLLPVAVKDQGASAYVSIQEGCDKFCTFCVVPYTRGSEFSRPVEQIYREVQGAIDHGSKEIYLLGQNVNAYHGKTFEGKQYNLADLISHIATIRGLERIRYITSHPIDMNDELIDLHGSEKKLMPFLHLPVQSGSDRILQAMNRKHNREFYFNIIDKVMKVRPDIALSSDFIVGFPGETDQDFADTLDLVKKIKFAQSFSFKYSPRPGTPAAMKEQLPEHIKNERLQILQAELAKQQQQFNEAVIGKILPVLFERVGKFDNHLVGKTPYMQSVHIESENKNLIGNIANVMIDKVQFISLRGNLI